MEIGNWIRYSEAERRAIMDGLPARLAALASGNWTGAEAAR